MYPIKFTEQHFINPAEISDIEYITRGDGCILVITFRDDRWPVQFNGPDAEEAFGNWKTAYEELSKGQIAGRAA